MFSHVSLGVHKRRALSALTNTPNHGTKPNTHTSPSRYSARNTPYMATATAAAAPTTTPNATHYNSRMPTTFSSATGNRVVAASPTSTIANLATLLDEEDGWIKQIEVAHNQRLQDQIDNIWKDYTWNLQRVGPFARKDHTTLQQEVEAHIARLKKESDDELTNIIESERAERLINPSPEDKDRIEQIFVEQQIIMDNIKREQAIKDANRLRFSSQQQGESSNRTKRDIQQEQEETRLEEDWAQTIDPQLHEDRKMWRDTTQEVNAHLRERRQRDSAEAKAKMERESATVNRTMRVVEEARSTHPAPLRSQHSGSTLPRTPVVDRQSQSTTASTSRSSRSSTSDYIFADNTTSATSTPPSSSSWTSVHGSEIPSRQQQGARPMGVPTPDDMRRGAASSGSHGTGTGARSGQAATPSPSPLYGTPNYERWIPPQSSRETLRKTPGSGAETTARDGPTRKPSDLFGESPSIPTSTKLDESPTQNRRTSAANPSPRQQQSFSTDPRPSADPPRPVPSAPSRQSTWPGPHSQTTPNVPRRDDPPTRSFSASTPAATGVPQQASMPASDTQARTSSSAAYSSSYSSSTTTAKVSSSADAPSPTPRPHPTSSNAPKTTSTSTATPAAAPAPAPAPTAQPTSPFAADPSDAYRNKLRNEYVGSQEKRAEDERQRREEEEHAREEDARRKENERRAEEARKRGEQRRRMEEQAREAERREAQKRARKAGIPVPTGKEAPIPEVWAAYESHWGEMAAATQLRFGSIPWPVALRVSSPEMLIPTKIAAFILSPLHSQNKSRKDRLREALLRWHPDRFETKWLKKVVEDERDIVKEGVGIVVRVLNELLNAPDFG